MGVSQDTPLFAIMAGARMLRLADGPDEVGTPKHLYETLFRGLCEVFGACKVHWRTAARVELHMQKESRLGQLGHYQPNYAKVFRRSTDPISPEAQARLANFSKL